MVADIVTLQFFYTEAQKLDYTRGTNKEFINALVTHSSITFFHSLTMRFLFYIKLFIVIGQNVREMNFSEYIPFYISV